MFFDSGRFLVFVAVLYGVYRLVPTRGRVHVQNALLLAGSYFFYGSWNPRFVGLLLLSTGIDYLIAQRVEAAHARNDGRAARRWLTVSLTISLSLLGFFKYVNLWSGGLTWVLRAVGVQMPPLLVGLVLPTGISFYTFQTMAYMIDVYRKKVPASRSLLDFALYVAFFPQLLAGPIERAKDLMPQLKRARTFSAERTAEAGRLILWGLFKKVFIADNLTPYVRWGLLFGGVTTSADTYLCCVAFVLRIYCDFSGYTDMARGVAKLFGIDLSLNFNLPFFSPTPAALWNRWHITLNHFLRDYVYGPMRRALLNRQVPRRLALPLSTGVTFLLMGLWHGANAGFMLWGGFWGVVLIVWRMLEDRALQHPTLRAFFARPTLKTPLTVVGAFITFHLFALSFPLIWIGPSGIGRFAHTLFAGSSLPQTGHDAASLLYYASPLVLMQIAQARSGSLDPVAKLHRFLRVLIYALALVLLIVSGATHGEEFVYFRF